MNFRTICLAMLLGIVQIVAPSNAGASPSVVRYEYVDLGLTAGQDSYANSINNRAEIVGSAWHSGNKHAFAWRDGTARMLPGPPAERWSDATAINDSGQIAGYSAGSRSHAFIWNADASTDWGTTMDPADDTMFIGLNEVGDAVGWWHKQPILFRNGQATRLPVLPGAYGYGSANDINESGVIVGSSGYSLENGTPALKWENSAATRLPIPGIASMANAINDTGQIVGQYIDSTYHAFLLANGQLTTLGTGYAAGMDINNAGQVVGYDTLGSGMSGTLWDGGTEYDLNELANVPDGWRISAGRGINDAGWIVGYATSGSLSPIQRRAILLRPVVPEPGTLGLIAFAVPAFLMKRRRPNVC